MSYTATVHSNTPFPVGTLVTVFDEHPGVVLKGSTVKDMVLVTYQMPGGVKVRGNIAIADVKERKK